MDNPQILANPPPVAPETEPRESRINKQIVFLICIYLILSLSNADPKIKESDEVLIKEIQNKKIPKEAFLEQISKSEFEGEWTQTQNDSNTIIDRENGKFNMLVTRYSDGERLSVDIQMKKGQYLDDGLYFLHMPELKADEWLINQTSPLSVEAMVNFSETSGRVLFNEEQIFRTLKSGHFFLKSIKINFEISDNIVIKKIAFEAEELNLSFLLHTSSKSRSGTIFFALILAIVSFRQFHACLLIIKNFIEGSENPLHYSLLSLMMAMMWDAALCLTSFVEAFQNEGNIILFIVPAFLLCLLFTNLELRIMASVFQAISGDIRQVICQFNLVSYGGMIVMYPLIFYTNLATPLFLGFSLILLPQIYTNAVTGKRPNPNSVYYIELLLFRFIMILYLKCNPYNVFNLKPNYLLGFGCLLIVACQFGLLWIQKIYGPKKVLPKFLLPPVYGYQYELNVEEEEIDECVMCLEPLSKEPEGHPDDIEIGYKIMKTPCEHKYHSCCLVQWMRLKMECPQCRAKLPPFE